MNRLTLTRCLLTASIVVGSIVAAQAQVITNPQVITTSQLLHGGTRCDHVLALIHRHGVNNSVNEFASRAMLHHSLLGGVVVNEADWGDLQVAAVNQIVDQDANCGPKFSVLIRNNSCRAVCNFHVSAVGVLGRICPNSPNTTVTVGEIAAGETLQVVLTLPIEALAMGNRNGQIIGLQRLVVAIDSLDQLAETNEANNLKAFEVGQIPILSPHVETTVESASEVQTNASATHVERVNSAPAVTLESDVAKPHANPLQSAIKQMTVEQPSGTVR
ncbi:MAG: hypothetical protein AAGG48_18045 [Planctomycetota bacterium]